jgi:hypothetical protein
MKMCPRTRNHIHRPFSNVATLHHNGSGAIYLPHRVLLPAMRRVIVMTKVVPAVRRTRRMHPNLAMPPAQALEKKRETAPIPIPKTMVNLATEGDQMAETQMKIYKRHPRLLQPHPGTRLLGS